MQFVDKDDIQGRLRLLRYGLVAGTAATFTTSLMAAFIVVANTPPEFRPSLAQLGMPMVAISFAAAVFMIVVYGLYAKYLEGKSTKAEGAE